jgi:hypothetical protein
MQSMCFASGIPSPLNGERARVRRHISVARAD